MNTLPKTAELPSCHASEMHALYLATHFPACREKVLSHLRVEDFFFAENRMIFSIMRDMAEDRAPITEMTVAERLIKSLPEEKQTPAISHWWTVFGEESWTFPGSLDWHMERLIDASVRRGAYAEGGRIQLEAADTMPDFSSRELIDSAEERLRNLRREASNATEADIKELFASYGDDYTTADGVAERSVPIGIQCIDAENRGPFGSELVVIAARPSVGKTAFALQSALCAATEGHPSYIFSLEMDKNQMRDRAISHLSKIPLSKLKARDLDEGEINRYTNALAQFRGKCRVNFKLGMSAGEICQAARTAHRVLGLKLIMVDYLGLIRMEGRQIQLHERIGAVTREMKLLALELGIPVLLLAQLNRESEKAGREPQLSDLASSGSIEQDADQVWLLHAPNGIGEIARILIVVKGRNTGAGYRVRLNFLTAIQTIEQALP